MEAIRIERNSPSRKPRMVKSYGPSLTHQLAENLAKQKNAEDCWAVHLAVIAFPEGASSKTVRKWRRMTKARIEAIARERSERPLIVSPYKNLLGDPTFRLVDSPEIPSKGPQWLCAPGSGLTMGPTHR